MPSLRKETEPETETKLQYENMKLIGYTSTKGKTHPDFESPFDCDEDAKDALVAFVVAQPTNAFAVSILTDYTKCKAKGWTLSEAKRYWLHKMTMPKVKATAVAGLKLGGICTMFKNAMEKLKRPKVEFSLTTGHTVCIKPSFSERFNGNLMVSASKKFGSPWYGRVELATGDFYVGSSDMPPEVQKFLSKFARNPALISAQYGKETCSCCYCGLELTDDRSKRVGYGRKCAKNYGLPWGEPVTRAPKRKRAIK